MMMQQRVKSAQSITYDVKQILSIIPDEFQIQVYDRGIGIKRDKFWIGQMTNILIWQIERARGLEVGRMAIYAAMSHMLNSEISSRTIQYYTRVVRFFPRSIFREFADLPFSHFTLALQYGDLWKGVLNLSRRQKDLNGGRSPSVQWLRSVLSGVTQAEDTLYQYDEIQAQETAVGDLGQQETISNSIDIDNVGGRNYNLDRNIIAQVEMIMVQLTGLVKRADWTNDDRVKIANFLRGLADRIEDKERVI